MFHSDNGGTELAIGWNSRELGDLLLKVKVKYTSSFGSVLM
jgi:hypothetical protein